MVIPCLLELQEHQYGVAKGIPTLVMAAASFDNVLCISGFGVCLGIAFDSGNNVMVQKMPILPIPLKFLIRLMLSFKKCGIWYPPPPGMFVELPWVM